MKALFWDGRAAHPRRIILDALEALDPEPFDGIVWR